MTAKPGSTVVRTTASPALAFSYVRFSSAEQSRGDSLRRQTEAAQAWCDRNNARLDASTTLHDLGKSAFKGAHRTNPDRNALAAFVKLVESGKVARGSFLVIESLDRLTREHIRPALTLVLNLIEAGVRIVQLKPVEVVYDEDVEPMQLMMALMELSRGNSESRIKSERIGAAHANKRTDARNGKLLTRRTHTRSGKLATRNLPAWVKIESIERDRFTLGLIPERAEVVARIFALGASGLGLMRVVEKLTEEGVPAFGRLLTDKDIAEYEERRRTNGKPPLTAAERSALRRPGYWRRGEWVDPAWNRGYVHDILTDRRAVGEYSPRARRGLADGPPIPDYFPAVVDEAKFAAARAAMTERKPREGRRVGKYVDLFSRMIFDAVDGSPYHTATKTELRFGPQQRRRRLVNASAGEGRCPSRSFPLETFEKTILIMLREIDPKEVLGEASPAADIAALERQLGWLADRQAELAAELRNGDIPVIAQQLRELKTEESSLAAKLDESRQLAAKPLSKTWRDLGGLLDATADPDARRRLRSAISRVIDNIQLLVVPRGRDRFAAVQVNFAGGEARRNYLIIHRPPLWLGTAVRPGRWWAASVKHPDDGLNLNTWDFRDQEYDQADFMSSYLQNYPKDMADKLLSSKSSHPV